MNKKHFQPSLPQPLFVRKYTHIYNINTEHTPANIQTYTQSLLTYPSIFLDLLNFAPLIHHITYGSTFLISFY